MDKKQLCDIKKLCFNVSICTTIIIIVIIS